MDKEYLEGILPLDFEKGKKKGEVKERNADYKQQLELSVWNRGKRAGRPGSGVRPSSYLLCGPAGLLLLFSDISFLTPKWGTGQRAWKTDQVCPSGYYNHINKGVMCIYIEISVLQTLFTFSIPTYLILIGKDKSYARRRDRSFHRARTCHLYRGPGPLSLHTQCH